MFRTLIFVFSVSFCFNVSARQKYYDNKFEKGYGKNGKKVGYWEYYDSDEKLELKYNHTNGRLAFLANDSSDYIVKVKGEWLARSFRIYPIMIGSESEYYRFLGTKVDYPFKAREKGLTGTVYVTFEIDSIGIPQNFEVKNDLCLGCNDKNLEVLKEALGVWIPAQENGIAYNSRFIQPIEFKLGEESIAEEFTVIIEVDGQKYKSFDPLLIVGYSRVEVQEIGFQNQETNSLGKIRNVDPITLNYKSRRDYTDKVYFDLEKALLKSDSVKFLNLSGKRLKSVPSQLSAFSNLEALKLDENRISEITTELEGLVKINELLLDRNELNNLPDQLKDLTQIEILTLSNNKFEVFPQVITQLKNLKVLDISNCNISKLPAEIGIMQQLEILNIKRNNITEFPDEFYGLSNLKELYMNARKLDEVELEKLKSRMPKLKIMK